MRIAEFLACLANRILGVLRRAPAANDNASAAAPRRSNRRSELLASTAAVYVNKTSGRPLVVINVAPQDAEATGINAGQAVQVAATDNGLVIRQAGKGTVVTLAGRRLRIQAGGVWLAPMAATAVRLIKQDNGDVLVTFGGNPPGGARPVNDNGPVAEEGASPSVLPQSYLDDFNSLSGKAGKRRLKFLVGNDNVKQDMATTDAGDECYTPRFLIDVILAAARRSRFCVDFCSMRDDGRYDLDLSQEVIDRAQIVHPRAPGRRLPVIGPVPADRHLTKDATECGSLLLEWWCEFGWLNPPYSLRSWTVFLEKAAREVAVGRAKTIVALVPMDTFGPHIRYLFEENAYRIELSRMVPFFMRRKTRKDKATGQVVEVLNTVEPIKGNSLVVFGTGVETRDFLLRLVDGLLDIDFITDEQARHYREQYQLSPRLNVAA